MRSVPGVVSAIVHSLDDPEGLGRIQLTFPWLSEQQPASYWARLAAPLAGAERGLQFMPEVGDEVLVAFEQGEFRLPYIVGGLWNGEDPPPQPDPKVRTIKSVSGHLLELDDTEGTETITLKWKGGEPSLILEQTKLSLKFDEGNFIEISASGVKIQGTLIELN